MAEPPPNVRLNLSNTPENVVLVREMLSGVAEAMSFNGSCLNDIRTAVTEACNNVVLHAYEGERGPLEVEVQLAPRGLNVLVRDYGSGIDSESERSNPATLGIGLHVIRTLTHQVEFKAPTEGGTEVCMEFTIPSSGPPAMTRAKGAGFPALTLSDSPTTITVSISPVGLARTVLPRVVSALAARAHFTTDRISDVQLLADALVTYAHGATSGDHLSVGVKVEPRDLELQIAPLGVGRGRRLIGESELEDLGSVIEKLTDRRDIVTLGPYETLTLGLVDRR